MRPSPKEHLLKGHIHILGICGTFMGGIALLARELGYKVSGGYAGCQAKVLHQFARTKAGVRCEYNNSKASIVHDNAKTSVVNQHSRSKSQVNDFAPSPPGA